jgi:Mn-dependent DtxR family transcriptional regulator
MRVVNGTFANLGLERAIGLRWRPRDIQARRLKMSPISDEDMRVLIELGLIEERDEGVVLTQAGTAVVSG